jgi:hypothetical protein
MKEREQQWKELTTQADPVVYQKLTQTFLRSLAEGVSDDTVLFPLRVSLRTYQESENGLCGTETACWLPDTDSLADTETKLFIQSVREVFERGMARVRNYHLGFRKEEVLVVNGMRRHVCHHLASQEEVQSTLGAAVREATETMRKTYLGTSEGMHALRRLLGEGNIV